MFADLDFLPNELPYIRFLENLGVVVSAPIYKHANTVLK